MTQPTQTLPDRYKPFIVINLAQDLVLAVVLNVAAIFCFFVTSWLLKLFTNLVHLELAGSPLSQGFGVSEAIWLLVLIVIILVIHELIHGFFSTSSPAQNRYSD